MLTLQLPPDLERRLAAAAQARGLDLPAYATQLLASAATSPESSPPPRTPEELEAFFEIMTEGSERLPRMATETFTRESFYDDDDRG